MTLIPAFACNGAFVIHADSEENCGAFRRSVQKIIPQKMGQLDVIIAGSGIGDLIDGFTARLKERLDADNASSIAEVKRRMEARLPNFLNVEVANYPCSDDEKQHKFIVAAYSATTKDFAVWASRNTVLIPVTSYEMAGVEDRLYDYVARQFYRPDMTVPQAILAGLYVLTVAESTSSYVRGPFRTAIIWEGGIEVEKEENTRTIVERLKQYEAQMNALFLACADTTVGVPEMEDKLNEFKQTVLRLHQDHIDQQAANTTFEEAFRVRDTPLRTLPRGLMHVTLDGLHIEHDRAKIQEISEQFKKLRELGEDYLRKRPLVQIVECNICHKKFFAEAENTGELHFTQQTECFHCHASISVEWRREGSIDGIRPMQSESQTSGSEQ